MKKSLSAIAYIVIMFLISSCANELSISGIEETPKIEVSQTSKETVPSTITSLPIVLPTSTSIVTKTTTVVLTETSTTTPVPTLTATPVPEVDLSSFVFPFDLAQVRKVWNAIPNKNRMITYHITHRPALDDPCGYHPGDILKVADSTKQDLPSFDVIAPYSGKVINRWKDMWGGDCYTFAIGQVDGISYYLDSYHTGNTGGPLLMESWITQGGSYSIGKFIDHSGSGKFLEGKIHLTIFKGDEISDSMKGRLAPGSIDMSQYALGPTLKAVFDGNLPLLITFEGANYCNMSPKEKIDTILNSIIPKAGFCVESNKVTYCGDNNAYQVLIFSITKWSDQRSVYLKPIK